MYILKAMIFLLRLAIVKSPSFSKFNFDSLVTVLHPRMYIKSYDWCTDNWTFHYLLFLYILLKLPMVKCIYTRNHS